MSWQRSLAFHPKNVSKDDAETLKDLEAER